MSSHSPICSIVAGLRARGVHLWCDGDVVHYRSTSSELSEVELLDLRTYKLDLLAFLRTEKRHRISHSPLVGNRPLSHIERWWWDQEQISAETQHPLIALQFAKGIDRQIMIEALSSVVRRQDALSTRYYATEDGPVGTWNSAEPQSWEFLDLSDGAQILENDEIIDAIAKLRRRPFRIEGGLLFRPSIVRLNLSVDVLLLHAHHCLLDRHAGELLVAETLAEYFAKLKRSKESALEPITPYSQYALWDAAKASSSSFWQERLFGWKGTKIPSDFPERRSLEGSPRGLYKIPLSDAQIETYRGFCRSRGITFHVLLLAAFAATLKKVCRQERIVIGCFMHGRVRPDLFRTIGCFALNRPIDIVILDNSSFLDLLKEMQLCYGLAYNLNNTVDAKTAWSVGLNRVAAHFSEMPATNQPPAFAQMPSVVMLDTERTKIVHHDICLNFSTRGTVVEGNISYAKNLFKSETISLFARNFCAFLACGIAAPDAPLVDLPE